MICDVAIEDREEEEKVWGFEGRGVGFCCGNEEKSVRGVRFDLCELEEGVKEVAGELGDAGEPPEADEAEAVSETTTRWIGFGVDWFPSAAVPSDEPEIFAKLRRSFPPPHHWSAAEVVPDSSEDSSATPFDLA